jgi:hypothetical protein
VAVLAAVFAAAGMAAAAPAFVAAQGAAPAPVPATASPPADDGSYEGLIGEAVQEYASGNFAEARALFERAHALKPNARTLRGLGVTAFELKRYVESLRELQASLDDSRNPLTDAQRQEVQALIPKARRFVGRIRLEVTGAKAAPEVYVDDRRVAGTELWLDLGTYRVSIRAAGYREAALRLVVEGGEDTVQHVELVPLDVAPRASLAPGSGAPAGATAGDQSVVGKWWFWTGIGAVVLGGTAVALAVALGGDGGSEPLYEGSAGSLRGP